MQYSDDELLDEIRKLASELGHPPSLAEFREQGRHSASTYYSRFGSWNEAIEQAGYDPNESDSKVSEADLLEELQRLADDLNKKPTALDMNKHGRYWRSTYKNEFGSWNNALEAAGFESENVGATITADELIEEINRLATEIGGTPRFKHMEDLGNYDPTTYSQHFGSWNEALDEAGFEPENRGSKITEKELLDEITRLKNKLGDPPSARQMDEIGKYASATYQRHFESWSNAIEIAFD
ncbi:hypothetical protein BDK61_4299 [Haloarcula quadrata]|uniref:Uncharacterized protein n=1 Tax=Haloarcula quadrata TaxID=182779 RepID=A0A495QQK9_9EURY|nr:hypothetical protein [Haloarcula quadrata]RKS75783.1 hypothetical protein BDK61_4299 [Haloarcula quadrata]